MGFGWGKRSTPRLTFWAPTRTASSPQVVASGQPRGFNMRSAIADPAKSRLYRPEELWLYGDPVRGCASPSPRPLRSSSLTRARLAVCSLPALPTRLALLI